MSPLKKSYIITAAVIILVCLAAGIFFYELAPLHRSDTTTQVFEIKQGDGFRTVADHLYSDNLIHSPKAFDLFALIGGRALTLKPGLYRLDPAMSVSQMLDMFSGGDAGEATVTIPEGSNIFEVDRILSAALIIHAGDLINFHDDGNLEGKLFPDTYQFYTNANIKDVVGEFTDNFNAKALPLLNVAPKNSQRDLILASILEKEVPSSTDQKLVAGILLKRLAAGMPLDVDATVCYAKLLENQASRPAASQVAQACYPLTALDFKIDSPYNTYLYRGLPPGPIGNPGVSAIMAAIHPVVSPYWYYLSDPKTGKTIFAKTLDEQTQNRVKYLGSN
jgi:UPF0755 protein